MDKKKFEDDMRFFDEISKKLKNFLENKIPTLEILKLILRSDFPFFKKMLYLIP